mmetsp:Transcript_49663/g.106923  ORF Transcript_49663/g.106923 Transcript_49663/m.106923 type:complete len:338 (-) Transcript_49663:505-1518(-)
MLSHLWYRPFCCFALRRHRCRYFPWCSRKREWPHSSLFLLLVLAVWSSHSSSRLQGPDDRGGRSFAELEVRPGSCGRTKAARASCSLLHDFRAPDDRPARVLLGHQEASKVACGPFLEQPELSPEAALAEDRRDEVVGPTGEMLQNLPLRRGDDEGGHLAAGCESGAMDGPVLTLPEHRVEFDALVLIRRPGYLLLFILLCLFLLLLLVVGVVVGGTFVALVVLLFTVECQAKRGGSATCSESGESPHLLLLLVVLLHLLLQLLGVGDRTLAALLVLLLFAVQREAKRGGSPTRSEGCASYHLLLVVLQLLGVADRTLADLLLILLIHHLLFVALQR